MADQEEIISELVAKFKVDKPTLEEAARDVSGFQERVQTLNKEASRVHLEGLKASQDTSKEAYLKNLSDVELLVKAHYERLKQIHKDNADQILKIQNDLTNDLKIIQATRNAVLTPSTPENREALGQVDPLKGIMGSLGSLAPLLSTLGVPMLIGGTSMITIQNLIKEFTHYQGQVMATNRLGYDLSAGAGQFGTGFGFAASKGLEELGHTLALDPKSLAQTAAMLTPIMGLSGAEGGVSAVNLTRDVTGLSKRYGTSESDVAGVMGMYRRLEDTPVEGLSDKFNALANAALSASRPVNAFAKDVMQLTQLNSAYGGNLEANIGLISLFSRELQNGIVTVQDLSRMQFGFANKDPGTQAWVANQLLSRGLIGGQAAAQLRGLSPVSMAYQIRDMYETPGPMHDAISKGIADLSEQQADRFTGSARSPRDREVMAKAIQHQLINQFAGVEGQTEKATDLMIQAMQGHKEASKGMLEAATTTKSAQQAVEEGIKSITDNITIQRSIAEGIQATGENIYRTLDRWVRPEIYAPGGAGYMAETAEKAAKIRGLSSAFFHDPDAVAGFGNQKSQFSSFAKLLEIMSYDSGQFFEASQMAGMSAEEMARFHDEKWIKQEYARLSKNAVGVALPVPYHIEISNKTPSAIDINVKGTRSPGSTPSSNK